MFAQQFATKTPLWHGLSDYGVFYICFYIGFYIFCYLLFDLLFLFYLFFYLIYYRTLGGEAPGCTLKPNVG